MRFVSAQIDGRNIVAVRLADGLREVPGASDLRDLLDGGLPSLRDAESRARQSGKVIDESNIRYLPVVPSPRKIFCIGLNYVSHANEAALQKPTYPVVVGRFATSLTGHRGPIVLPAVSEQLDFEGELAVIIGRKARGIRKDQALDYVAGYSVFNEATVRDYQFKSTQWMLGKNFDRTGALGPELVTVDELEPGAKNLRIRTEINGELRQEASTSDMIFEVARLIECISEVLTLEPGDVIATGTPGGVGFGRKPPTWLKAGDRCKVMIEGIGSLENVVADE